MNEQQSLAYHQSPCGQAYLKLEPEDFIVEEVLPFELAGQGEHIYVYCQKRQYTTQQLIKVLSQYTGIAVRHIGYSGLKDKQGVTTQWLSLWDPSRKVIHWDRFDVSNIQLLQINRHIKKLKIGTHNVNAFKIRLRMFSGDKKDLLQRIETIQSSGFPNYFGPQRFGQLEENFNRGLALLRSPETSCSRTQRSLYLSAFRSAIFNVILSKRIKLNNWNKAILGDLMVLTGSQSFFLVDQLDDKIQQRVTMQDISPSGVMIGQGKLGTQMDAYLLEKKIISPYECLPGLAVFNLRMDRRPLRAVVQHLNFVFDDNDVILSFQLPKGSYATSLLRELIQEKVLEKDFNYK